MDHKKTQVPLSESPVARAARDKSSLETASRRQALLDSIDKAQSLCFHYTTASLIEEAARQARFSNFALAEEGLRRALESLPELVDGARTDDCWHALSKAFCDARACKVRA